MEKHKKQKNPSPAPSPKKTSAGSTHVDSSRGSLRKKKRLLDDDLDSHPFILADRLKDWSPYLVIRSTNNTDMAKLSVLAIDRALRSSGVEPQSVSRLHKSGELLVHVRLASHAKKLLQCTVFGDIPVEVQPDKVLNSSKGVVKDRELMFETEEELSKLDGVTNARRIKLRRDGKEILTNTWVFTFSQMKPPTSLRVGFLELEVKPWVPNPRRCFKCHRFGHTQQRCRRPKAVCARCGTSSHGENDCKVDPPKCCNCGGEHMASSKECPKYLEEKCILEYKSRHGGTFSEAKKALRLHAKSNMNFAAAVKNGKSVANTSLSSRSTADIEKEASQPQTKKRARKTGAAPQAAAVRKAKEVETSKGISTSNRFELLKEKESEDMEMEVGSKPIQSLLSMSTSPSKANPPLSKGVPPFSSSSSSTYHFGTSSSSSPPSHFSPSSLPSLPSSSSLPSHPPKERNRSGSGKRSPGRTASASRTRETKTQNKPDEVGLPASPVKTPSESKAPTSGKKASGLKPGVKSSGIKEPSLQPPAKS